MHLFKNIFLACLLASAFSALYSEIVARIQKAPTTLFFITSVIPLIPGSTLYHACSNAVVRQWSEAKHYATVTLQYALAIAAGACIVWAITLTIENIKKIFEESGQTYGYRVMKEALKNEGVEICSSKYC